MKLKRRRTSIIIYNGSQKLFANCCSSWDSHFTSHRHVEGLKSFPFLFLFVLVCLPYDAAKLKHLRSGTKDDLGSI